MGSKMLFSLTSPRLFSAVSRKPTSSFSPSSSRTQLTPAKSISLRRRVFLLPAKATTEQSGGDNVDSNVLPYCSINRAEKKTIGEMEQEFLQAMQSFYYDGKAIMSNEEFDNLKDELMWEGSSVVMLSSDEQRFLEASMAYVSGNPILNDEEYDKLKLKLKIDGSEIVCEGPRCSLRSKKELLDGMRKVCEYVQTTSRILSTGEMIRKWNGEGVYDLSIPSYGPLKVNYTKACFV